ncbi:cytochrome ubiquinol oxidase subunit I, partial [Bacillus cereus]|nr:cytochrome ubiquinol oxidase subunit I [Bacillus cereus]
MTSVAQTLDINVFIWNMFFHTVVGCYIVGAFFVMAISAYHLLRKNEVEFFKKSFKFGL